MGHGHDSDSRYNLLTEAYGIVKVVLTVAVSVAATLVSVAALSFTISEKWRTYCVSLRVIVAVGGPVIAALVFLAILSFVWWRGALKEGSYYKNAAIGLTKSVSYYQDLAFNDPITGVANSRGLQKELSKALGGGPRCLILLDLIDFRQVNNKHNHWKGDEYLRRFAEMVTTKNRRDEHVFKKRPIASQQALTDESRAVQTFRRNSGGDEFFILLEGTIVDGLGYLNRLQRRAHEFEKMALEILGSAHPFGFRAGITTIISEETFDSINERVSMALLLAKENYIGLRLFWNDKELPPIEPGSFQEKIVNEAKTLFKN